MGILKHLVLTGSLMLVAVTSMANPTFSSDKTDFRLETIAQGLEHPWSLAFLPDGTMLVTEREGRLRRIENGNLVQEPVRGLPDLVASGQGGLLDVVLHPQFENNQTLFLSYAHRNSDSMTTRVARATYNGEAIAKIARPVKIGYTRKGLGATLTLLTTGPNAPMVQMQLPQIKDRVNATYGYAAISRIHVTQTSPTGFAEPQTGFQHQTPQKRPISQDQKQALATSLSDVSDNGLKSALAALGENVLSKPKA